MHEFARVSRGRGEVMMSPHHHAKRSTGGPMKRSARRSAVEPVKKSSRSTKARTEKTAKKKTATKAARPSRAKTVPAKAKSAGRRSETEKAARELARSLELLHAKEWTAARQCLEAILDSGVEDARIRDRARSYLQICDRNQRATPARPTGADELYDLGVLRLNAGELEEAVALFEKACARDATSDKAEYGLAVALAQSSRPGPALEHLRRAIERNPDNRVFAANDSDLALLRDEIEFVELTAPRGSERGLVEG